MPEAPPSIPARIPAPFARRLQSFQWHLEGGGAGSPRTVAAYLGGAILFGLYLADVGHDGTLERIGAEEIRDWLRRLKAQPHPRTGRPLAAATVNNRGRALQAFFRWASDEYDFPDPMAKVRVPKAGEQPLPDLSDADLAALLAAAEGRDFAGRRDTAFLRLLLDTGMRRNEIATLRVDALDLRACKAHARVKGGTLHAYLFSKRARQALDRYLTLRERHAHTGAPLLWLGREGPLTSSGCYQIVRDRARLAADACPDPSAARRLRAIHPHTLRSVAAVRYLEAGGNAENLNHLMNWRSPTMAARYTRGAKARLAEEEYRRLRIGEDL